jgi:hypothetical protein
MSPYSSAPHEQNIKVRRGRNPIENESHQRYYLNITIIKYHFYTFHQELELFQEE